MGALDEARTAAIRDASELLWPSVAETLATLELGSQDAGARKLAERYAQVIDRSASQAEAMRTLGPLLLKALDALGATPEARARITRTVRAGGDSAKPEVSWLDQQRQSRSARSAKRT